jgi:hypothetical protein
MKHWLLSSLLICFGCPAGAYERTFWVDIPDAEAMRVRIESATGLNFSGKCAWPDSRRGEVPACAIHGNLEIGATYLRIVVYEHANADPRVTPVVITDDLKRKIATAVLGG